MSVNNPDCIFDSALERWSECDGHWDCCCPLPKSPKMEQALEDLVKAINPDRTRKPTADGTYRCTACGKDIDIKSEFRDDLSRTEFGISRMCQKCQDSIFGASDD